MRFSHFLFLYSHDSSNNHQHHWNGYNQDAYEIDDGSCLDHLCYRDITRGIYDCIRGCGDRHHKSRDEDKAIPTATGIGLNPSDMAIVISIGPMRLVDAVFDVTVVSKRVKMQKTAMKIISVW